MLLPGERATSPATTRSGSCSRRGSPRRTDAPSPRCTSSARRVEAPCARAAPAGRRRRTHHAAVHGTGTLLRRRCAALAWRLDLILRGWPTTGCSTPTRPSGGRTNEWIVNLSTEMGRVSCMLDEAAAQRDARCAPPRRRLPLALPPLEEEDARARRRWPAPAPSGRHPPRRHRGPRRRRGRQGLRPVTRAPRTSPGPGALLDRIGAHAVALDEVEDLDGRPTAWLDEHGVEAVVMRPDAYVFGAVEALDDLPGWSTTARHLAITDHLTITESRSPQMPADRVIHPEVPPRQLQDHLPAGDDRLVHRAGRRPRSCSSTPSGHGCPTTRPTTGSR